MSLDITLTTPRNSFVKLDTDVPFISYLDSCSEDDEYCLPLVNFSDLQWQLFGNGADFVANKGNIKIGITKDGSTLIQNAEGYSYGTITWSLIGNDSTNPANWLGTVTLTDQTVALLNQDDCFQLALYLNQWDGPTHYEYDSAHFLIGLTINGIEYNGDLVQTCTPTVVSDLNDLLTFMQSAFGLVNSIAVTWNLSGGTLIANSAANLGGIRYVSGDEDDFFTSSIIYSIITTSNCFYLSDGCYTTLVKYYSDDNEFGFLYIEPSVYTFDLSSVISYPSVFFQYTYNGHDYSIGLGPAASISALATYMNATESQNGAISWFANGTNLVAITAGVLTVIAWYTGERPPVFISIPTVISFSYFNKIRLPFELRAPQEAKKKGVYQKADGTYKKLYARINEVYDLETDWIKQEHHRKMNVALESDHFFVWNTITQSFNECISEKDDYKIDWQKLPNHPTVATATCTLTVFIDEINSNCND